MKYLLLFLLSGFVSTTISAQTNVNTMADGSNLHQISALPITAGATIATYNVNKGSDIKGSIYLYDNWNNSGKIFFTNNATAYSLPTSNFNIQSRRVEMKYAKDSLFVINSANIDKIIIRDKTFKLFKDPDYKRDALFEEVFSSEDVLLVKKYKLAVNEGQVNHMTGRKLSPDKYIKKEIYYISKDPEKQDFNEVNFNKKLLYSLVEKDNQDKVKAFYKEKNLSYKDENDLKILLNYSKSL
ncbi:hypothetical protein ACJOV8_008770 [Formosa sp. 3Alg 14/1]|uniref:hypothetical protein n=1 Tax=unclassified Formosa TaxID=2644710 RepID=UPI0039BEB9E9